MGLRLTWCVGEEEGAGDGEGEREYAHEAKDPDVAAQKPGTE